MWLPEPMPIEVSRPASIIIGLQFVDSITEEIINLSGYSIQTKVAPADGEQSFYNPESYITNPEEGICSILFVGSFFDGMGDAKSSSTFSYQTILTDQNNIEFIVLRGPIILTPGIS